MCKQTSLLMVALVSVVAVLAPIGGAYFVAKQHSANDQMARAGLIADDVLRRSEETSAQISAAFAQLQKSVRLDPCSDTMIRKMASIDVASSQLQAVGYVSHNRLVCSSLGRHADGLKIGMPDYITQKNVAVRNSRELAEIPGVKLLIVTNIKDGFTALVHRDLPIDVFASDEKVSVGVFGLSNMTPLLGRGDFTPEWMASLGHASKAEFLTESHVVATRRSARFDFAVYAALPISEVNADFARTAVILLPIGALAGILLALAVLFIVRQQLAMPSIIKLGLKRNEFFLEYQPIVDLQTGHWTGAEALIRWRRPKGEIIRPDHFIPVAEANGLIRNITQRVIRLAQEDAAGLFRRHPHCHLSLNLSADDMHSANTIDLLLELARETGAGPGNIVVEATERGFMQADLARSVVDALHGHGFKVAIDDFGTGYSSLSCLETFKFDYLKIDKSFVDTINTDAPTSQVVLHVIELARDLNIKMIAEGVETEEQARFLRSRGVQYAQGWLFGKPMRFADFSRQLRQHSAVADKGAQVLSICRAAGNGTVPATSASEV